MKAYKGFNKDMTCRGYQFEEGKTFESEKAELCHSGFHACEDPMDCLGYYPPASSVYHEVELDGVSDERQSDDSKVCAKRISIGARLDIAGLVRASISYVMTKVKATTGDWAHSATTGDWAHSATTGDGARSATTGYRAHSATTGDWAHSATTGNGAHSATTGDWAHSATTGDGAHSATTGNGAHSATTGYRAHSATTGDWAHSATTGNGAHSKVSGQLAIAAALGIESRACAALGCWIVLAEYKEKTDGWELLCVKAAKVDGDRIKPGIWYQLRDGVFVEAKEDADE